MKGNVTKNTLGRLRQRDDEREPSLLSGRRQGREQYRLLARHACSLIKWERPRLKRSYSIRGFGSSALTATIGTNSRARQAWDRTHRVRACRLSQHGADPGSTRCTAHVLVLPNVWLASANVAGRQIWGIFHGTDEMPGSVNDDDEASPPRRADAQTFGRSECGPKCRVAIASTPLLRASHSAGKSVWGRRRVWPMALSSRRFSQWNSLLGRGPWGRVDATLCLPRASNSVGGAIYSRWG